MGERRGVRAFEPHALNHPALLKPLLPRQRNEEQWQQAFKESARAEGGNLPMSECLSSREVGRRNRETGAAAGGPLGTKPFLKSQHAGWLNGGPRQRRCSADSDSARKSDYV